MFEVELKGKDSTGVPRTVQTDSDGNLLGEISGDVAADAADSGNPLKIGGVARTTNPTAVADADRVNATFDDLGRQLTRPVQVRDLIVTARATVSTGTETTLLSGASGSYHDLIFIHATNSSGAATTIDVRSVTGGNVVLTLDVPATGVGNSNPSVTLPVPYPQDATGNNWTVDMPDITGTTVTVEALFSKEV